jgi:hypothetical protein
LLTYICVLDGVEVEASPLLGHVAQLPPAQLSHDQRGEAEEHTEQDQYPASASVQVSALPAIAQGKLGHVDVEEEEAEADEEGLPVVDDFPPLFQVRLGLFFDYLSIEKGSNK